MSLSRPFSGENESKIVGQVPPKDRLAVPCGTATKKTKGEKKVLRKAESTIAEAASIILKAMFLLGAGIVWSGYVIARSLEKALGGK